MLTEGLGYPLRYILTAGQASDSPQAIALLEGIVTNEVLADKGYDTNAILAYIQDVLKAKAVIPPKKNRNEPQEYDKHAYKERHLVECFINKIKHFRRVFTRYEKYAERYMDFLNLAATLIWLR